VLLNQFATLMPPYPAGCAGLPLITLPNWRAMILPDRVNTIERSDLADQA
jgi:hypothetical protein